MKRLTRKIVILFLPIIMWIGLSIIVGLQVGGLYPISYIAQLQAENRDIKYEIIGSGNIHMEYKFQSILAQKPKLLMLGSSRSWYFKDYLSNRCPSMFYNASFGGNTIYEIRATLEEIIKYQQIPEVILITLDYPTYNLDEGDKFDIQRLHQISPWKHLLDSTKRYLIYTFSNPSLILNIFTPKSKLELGLGFLDNGTPSYYNGDGSSPNNHFSNDNIKNLDTNILISNQLHLHGSEVDENALDNLETILRLSVENNIKVIGFFPPYRSDFLIEYQDLSRYSYMPLATNKIYDLFSGYGFHVYDFSDLKTINGNDKGMHDSWHPGELLSLKIYRTLMINQPEILSKYSDLKYLDTLIENTTDTYNVTIDKSKAINNSLCDTTD